MSQSLAELLDLYNPAAPLEEAYTIPAPWYLDPRIEQAERDYVFAANWIAVGRLDQVAAEGQFFTVEIAGEPLVVVRGSDGLLRAFFNVCRHHAAAVANVPCGTVQHLRCPYHGWTYGLDGSLKGAPEFAGVCNFDRSANGLVPVRVETWEQFIFVTFDASAPPLETAESRESHHAYSAGRMRQTPDRGGAGRHPRVRGRLRRDGGTPCGAP